AVRVVVVGLRCQRGAEVEEGVVPELERLLRPRALVRLPLPELRVPEVVGEARRSGRVVGCGRDLLERRLRVVVLARLVARVAEAEMQARRIRGVGQRLVVLLRRVVELPG